MKHILRTTNVVKKYDTEAGSLEVLKGIDFTVMQGEVVAIIGASGVGKSTLLHVLGTLDRPSAGKIYYDDQDVFTFDDDKLAFFRNRALGFIFQFHHLLGEFTALENVMMPGLIAGVETIQLKKKAEALLSDFGLHERLRHRPGELSGGEQQRVAIARALILDPLVVLADEPTGNIDTKTGEGLIDMLFEINRVRQTTFVIVTHNPAFAARCHRVCEMVDGKLVSHR